MTLLAPTSYFLKGFLSQFIESINFYEFEKIPVNEPIQMFPEGVIEVVFQFGANVSHKTNYSQTWEKRHNAFVGGLHTSGYLIQSKPDTKLLSIRFKPGMAKYFIPIDLCHFTNGIVPVEEVWSKEGKDLVCQLETVKHLPKQVLLIEFFLRQTYNKKQASSIDQTVTFIKNKNGVVNLKSLSNLACLSTSQFRKRFRMEVGISPKYFARIIRVNAILKALRKRNSVVKLGDLAYQFNYFDQAHFIHDFKMVTGYSPKTFL